MKLHFKVLGRPAVELINRGMVSRNNIKLLIEQLQGMSILHLNLLQYISVLGAPNSKINKKNDFQRGHKPLMPMAVGSIER